MDILERIRYARDRALEAEQTERQRIADAENAEVVSAASVRLATRQAVREALDDILDESSEPPKATPSSPPTTDHAADTGPDDEPNEGETGS